MKVEDVMTREVVTVAPGMPLKYVADTLAARGISGAPVCDQKGHVLGVVSERDILFKEGEQEHAGPLYLAADRQAYEARAKAAARTAGEAMTSPAVMIEPERRVDEAARLMLDRDVNRLPVVRDGVLVGIVTRADLMRAFRRPDAEIAREIRKEVLEEAFGLEPGHIRLEVVRGEVRLEGGVEARSDARLVARLVARVPGVVSVDSRLTWSADDLHRHDSAIK
ncbi:MAG TPA: CBS domain-containing protein [Gaiellaceae bacterium]|nr:CBS domain-containing protein [Gaiellaceae bacterium]